MATDVSIEILSRLGLSPEQAEIYQSLLEKGPQTATSISHNTSVQRTYIYNLTEQLMEKGLVSLEKKGRTTLFKAQSPDLLLNLLEEQKQRTQQAERALEGILPQLKDLYAQAEERPVVSYYEGPEGVMRANMQILQEKTTILAYLVINKAIDTAMAKYWKQYYKKRIEDNIHVKALTPDTKEGLAYQKRDSEELRETRLISYDKFPIRIEKNIAGNKVAFFSIKNDILMATIIENKEIADAERAIFDLVWSQGNKIDRIQPK
jgi:HTH-type transcriptional regulator, sugar sensing transcriptional regulator